MTMTVTISVRIITITIIAIDMPVPRRPRGRVEMCPSACPRSRSVSARVRSALTHPSMRGRLS